MPPDPMAPLSAEQIATIKKWIDDGAKNVPCGSGGDCDTTNVTYSGVVRTIFQNNCLGCHNGGDGTNKHVDMSTMTGIKAVIADGRLVKSIEHAAGVTAMPYGGGKLPDCKIAQIKAWINLGAPNN